MSDQENTRLDEDELQALYQYAIVLCQDATNAEDLLQSGVETYLSEIKKKKMIAQPTQFIRRVIKNRFIDEYRYQQRWGLDQFEEDGAYNISPFELEKLHVDQQILEQIWSSLHVEDRDILYHWAVLGYSTDEACQLLNVPRGTFLSRIHRLRKKLNEKRNDNDYLKKHKDAQ